MLLSHYRTLFVCSLLFFAVWIPPVRAQVALVKDINLLPPGSAPSNLVAIGNIVYFSARTIDTGEELWRSDGTAAGTFLVKDILPGSGGSFPFFLTNVNGVRYFRADEGTAGLELWRSFPLNFRKIGEQTSESGRKGDETEWMREEEVFRSVSPTRRFSGSFLSPTRP